MFVAGVDGCREGWILVALHAGRFAGAKRHNTFDEVLETLADAAAVAVDIPIGLLDTGERACDAMTRAFVGPRHSSVFAVPPRSAMEATTYEEANRQARVLWGKGLSKQVFGLRHKILEVDAALRDGRAASSPRSSAQSSNGPEHPARRILDKREDRASLLRYARVISKRHGATAKPAVLVPDMREPSRASMIPELPAGRIVEAHPEASFCQMAGRVLEFGKKSYNGMMMRMRLLSQAGIEIPAELGEVGGVAIDDVLDAAAVAWSATRYAQGSARSFPPEDAWERDGDRILAIWV